MRPRIRAAAALPVLLAALPLPMPARAQAWTTRVVAPIPSPGYPAMAYVTPGGDIVEGTFDNPAGSSAPSVVRDLRADGSLRRSWTMAGENLSGPHGVQVAGSDARGRLVLLELGPPEVRLLDPATGMVTRYATFADLAPCAAQQTGPGCSPTLQDLAPEPDYSVWLDDGSLLVSDYQQGVIWRVPPGGGAAAIWLADRRFDGEQFGTAGLALSADRHTLYVAQGSSAGGGDGNPATGKLYSVEVTASRTPGSIRRLWESRPTDAPDGIAVARSGNVYMALVGPAANQIVEIAPDGTELTRYPSVPALGMNGSSIPFDSPSSVRFLGTELMVANQSFVAGDSTHWAVLAVDVGETGLPEFIPAVGQTAAPSAGGQVAGTPTTGLANTAAPGAAGAVGAVPLGGALSATALLIAVRRRRRG